MNHYQQKNAVVIGGTHGMGRATFTTGAELEVDGGLSTVESPQL